jgi:aminoglycoside 3-N-acetyltransferase
VGEADRVMHTRDGLAADLRRLGLEAGDTLMVHASVRAVGAVAGGPDQIHLAIKDVLTPHGTLMMYAGCPQYADEVGRGNLTPAQEQEVLAKLPPFDPATARSARDHGVLVECLRTWPGSRVNPDVTRFVFSGGRTEDLIAPQPWDFAIGAGSALERFVELGGKILLLGADHDAVTFLHYAEHIVDIPDKRIARFQVPTVESGQRVWRPQAEFDSANGVHANWPDRFFAKVTDTFLAQTGNVGGRVGDASTFLFRARELLTFALAVMQAVALDRRAAAALHELAI